MILLHNISQAKDVMIHLLLSTDVTQIYPNEMRKNGHFTPIKCANTPMKCAKTVVLPQRNAQIPQRNAQGISVNSYRSTGYSDAKKWEIIYKLLRNNLVILEIEKRAQKFWDFWSVSLSLRTGNTEIVVTNNNK